MFQEQITRGSKNVVVNDLAATTYAAVGLPAGLELDAATGFISGTPQKGANGGVKLYAGNENGYGNYNSADFTFYSSAEGIYPEYGGENARGVVGEEFSYQIGEVSEGIHYADGLPAGLELDAATGIVSGAPEAAGTYRVILYSGNQDGSGWYRSAIFTLANSSSNIDPSPTPTGTPPATGGGN